MARSVYLDHHATTPVDPRVVAAMLPYFTETFGNAGSVNHRWGEGARDAVEQARASVARALNAEPSGIVFTSGATESNNLAIKGIAQRARRRGNHLVSATTEHPAVLDPLAHLERQGYEATLVPVRPAGDEQAGIVEVDRLVAAFRPETALVSIMLANNEIGALHPVREVAAACRERGILFHCDATQAVGRMPIDVRELGVDLLSLSAHKFYGPKGVGALFVRQGAPLVRLEPQIDGGGQENGRRSGTLNVPGIIGLAAAIEIAVAELPQESSRLRTLRDRLWAGLLAELPEIVLNGPRLDPPDWRLPNNLNVAFPGVQGEALMLQMPEIALSSGSACSSVHPEPSHVLRALERSEDECHSSLRFGLGRGNDAAEIDHVVGRVVESVRRLRRLG